jgi:hypothetical protein
MNDAPETWRETIERIIAEIAADPKSHLLRVPSIDSVLSLARQSAVSALAPNLTKAERYLLATHREELAFLLRERCVMMLFSDTPERSKWHRSTTIDRDLSLPDDADWRRRTGQVLECELDSQRTAEERDLLGECVASNAPASNMAIRLAAASQRIVPTETASIYTAMQLLNDGRLEESRALHGEVLVSSTSACHVSMCWENIGFAYYANGRYSDAASAYRTSSAKCSNRVSPGVFWFTSAVSAGDASEASTAARFVEESVPRGHSIVAYAERTVRALASGDGALRRNAEQTASLSGTGENTRRLLDAFLG